MLLPRLTAPLALSLLLPGCQSTSAEDADGDGGSGTVSQTECADPVGSCGSLVCQHPNEGATHETPCEALSFGQNPPTSGTHYSVWADFKVYEAPISRGFYVHSLEHGAVVLAYNCDLYQGDCAALAVTLEEFRGTWAQDSKCDTATRNRIVVTPDPLLDVPFAAAAWDWSLRGDCFDSATVSDFITAHYGQTYEDICNTGLDPLDPDPAYPHPTDCP